MYTHVTLINKTIKKNNISSDTASVFASVLWIYSLMPSKSIMQDVKDTASEINAYTDTRNIVNTRKLTFCSGELTLCVL